MITCVIAPIPASVNQDPSVLIQESVGTLTDLNRWGSNPAVSRRLSDQFNDFQVKKSDSPLYDKALIARLRFMQSERPDLYSSAGSKADVLLNAIRDYASSPTAENKCELRRVRIDAYFYQQETIEKDTLKAPSW